MPALVTLLFYLNPVGIATILALPSRNLLFGKAKACVPNNAKIQNAGDKGKLSPVFSNNRSILKQWITILCVSSSFLLIYITLGKIVDTVA